MESLQGLAVVAGSVGGNHSSSTASVAWFHQLLNAVGVEDFKRASDLLVVLSAVVFILLTLVPKWVSGPVREKPQFPPSPPRWPVLGNLPQVMKEGAAVHTTLRLLGKKMGPIYTLWLGR